MQLSRHMVMAGGQFQILVNVCSVVNGVGVGMLLPEILRSVVSLRE